MWVRGLKLPAQSILLSVSGRTLCGCVDWNRGRYSYNYDENVAPYVGAWIETAEDTKGTK